MMRARQIAGLMLTLLALAASGLQAVEKDEEGFLSLFDGKSLQGWKASENPASFSVQDGVIVVHGPRAHLFYAGPVADHNFKNFHFKADVMTKPVREFRALYPHSFSGKWMAIDRLRGAGQSDTR